MAFIVVNGTIELPVVDISENDPILLGDEGRSSDGTHRGDISGEKRSWSIMWCEMTTTEYETLRAAVALLVPVTITGDALPGAPRTMIVRLSRAPYLRNGTGVVRDLSATLEDA
jgi:hypothetical protein